MALNVCEIFHSLQGESTAQGLPCTFIRLSGCNLNCSYCDTRYAFSGGEAMTIDLICSRAAEWPIPRVEITGGEPLIQEETPVLAEKFLDSGYQVLVETNGSMDIRLLPGGCDVIMDIKCPDSRMSGAMQLDNLKHLGSRDQVKFVIQSTEDFQFAERLIRRHLDGFPGGRILLSPVMDRLSPHLLAEWIIESGLDVRLQVQLHKILWPDQDRGV